MKKIIIMCALFLAVFSSCAAPSAEPLGYQKGISRVTCTLEAEGETMGIALTPEKRRAEVISPDFVSGVCVENREDALFLISEGVEMSLPADMEDLISPLVMSFSLPADGVISSTEYDGERVIRVSANGGEYTVILGEDGAPSQISFAGAREFTLKDIEIERQRESPDGDK